MTMTDADRAALAERVAELKNTDEFRGDTAGAAHHLAKTTGIHIRHYLFAYLRMSAA